MHGSGAAVSLGAAAYVVEDIDRKKLRLQYRRFMSEVLRARRRARRSVYPVAVRWDGGPKECC